MTEQEMRVLVPQKLKEIEEREGVRVLYAAESGSRAWDFASPDSDYDVRFLYLRPAKDYLRLEEPRDVLEYPIDDTWDVSGWDLKKALKLLAGGNATLFEWAMSPIVYRTTPEWEEQIRPVLLECFRPKKSLWHYLSMAQKNEKLYLGREEIKVKRYFYILRPILAARWVLERRTPAPMRFGELTDAMLTPELRPLVNDLVRRKRETPELGLIAPVPELDAYIRRELDALAKAAQQEKETPRSDMEALETLFAQLLGY